MNDNYKNLILVCVSDSKSNCLVINKAYEIANNEDAKLIALYVCPKDDYQNNQRNEDLQNNLDLAESMGAMVEILYDDDIATQIVNFAKLYKVKKIIIGRNKKHNKLFELNKNVCDELIEKIDDIDIHIVPVYEEFSIKRFENRKSILKDSFISLFILILSTIAGYLFYYTGFGESNIIMIYILGVFFIALITYNEILSMVASIICVLAFNFCFTQPTLSFSFYNKNYLITFLVLLVVSFLTSRLASQIKKNAENSSKMIYISKLILETNQMLQSKISKPEIIETGCRQLSNLLKRNIVYYDIEDNKIQAPLRFTLNSVEGLESSDLIEEKEIVEWVFHHNKNAGATTRYLPEAKYLYYTIRYNTNVYGIIGIYLYKDRLDSVENKILLAILGDMSLALEKEKVIEDKNKVNLKIKDEQLKTNLLRSISHDLRTPLTTICGNSDILLKNYKNLTEAIKLELYQDIYDDSQWLLNLIENLLSITKVEEGKIKLKIEPQIVEEVIEEALKHVNRDKSKHNINIEIDDEYLMANMDARLIIQVLINLIDNAIKYTDEGSSILIKAFKKDDNTLIQICDNGDGIRDNDKEKLFQKFYTSNNKISDSKRSIGLGLYLCKIIVEAHGGIIQVEDNHPSGSIFTIKLK
ncbi:MAG: sensor histidine kinase KdpD [Finegoldia magna]|uniref:DUF4118 domain-containing protein n=1 Tax=Finegoldia magna TaxID=1260 RepID=UPI0026F0831F|nr:DUF4118 domain-containing protein [Finegoldia magna]MBS5966081.1 sensor histidine kinase KdpD [Finegoldia magna]